MRASSAALHDIHGRVLDAGSGTGGFLADLFPSRRRPDLIPFAVEWDAAAWLTADTWSNPASATTRGSVNQLPFADGSFDAVVSADVLCDAAVDPGARALLELKRVLRPGGRLVVNMPAYPNGCCRRMTIGFTTSAASPRVQQRGNCCDKAGFSSIKVNLPPEMDCCCH